MCELQSEIDGWVWEFTNDCFPMTDLKYTLRDKLAQRLNDQIYSMTFF